MEPLDALSELDEYRFEAGGWLVLPAILTVDELAALNALLDEPGGASGGGAQQLLAGLGSHPSVCAAIDMLVSGKVRVGIIPIVTPQCPVRLREAR
jgi:hypothetical protein